MSGPDGFLARWSRRKLRVEEVEGELPAPPVAVEGNPAAAGTLETRDTLSPEELASLPRPEDMTAGSDISAFMREGVPDMLRKAALRRMWSLDPAVRDYVGDARDYAWDWNVVGGVPGSGPLGPLDDISASVGRMFSAIVSPDAPSAASDTAPPEAGASQESAALGAPACDPMSVPLASHTTGCESIRGGSTEGRPLPAAPDAEPAREAAPHAPLRRHGAAIPKLDLF